MAEGDAKSARKKRLNSLRRGGMVDESQEEKKEKESVSSMIDERSEIRESEECGERINRVAINGDR